MHTPESLVPSNLLLYLHKVKKFRNSAPQIVCEYPVMASENNTRRGTINVYFFELMQQKFCLPSSRKTLNIYDFFVYLLVNKPSLVAIKKENLLFHLVKKAVWYFGLNLLDIVDAAS
jgi:hypothetical protein